MSKSICSYPKSEQAKVVERRLKGEARGLGYLAAVDSQKAIARKNSTKAPLTQKAE